MPEPATVRSEEFVNAFDYRDPEPRAGAYTRRRLAQAAAGQLAVTVDHADLLVLQTGSKRGESA